MGTVPFSPRRGIVLLLMLAILAMFGLLAVAFVVLTGHARRGAQSVERIDRAAESPKRLLQQAAMQVLRGSPSVQTLTFTGGTAGTPFNLNDTISVSASNKTGMVAAYSSPDNGATGTVTVIVTGFAFVAADSITDATSGKTATVAGVSSAASVMGAHSLLEGIYGNNWFVGQITGTPTAVCGNQLIEFTYSVSSNGLWNPTLGGGSWIADPNPRQRIGCVVTFYDPPLAGVSTRIVGVDPTSNAPQMVAVEGLSTASFTGVAQMRFVINGVPFSGTGFGYNSTTGNVDLRYDSSTGQVMPPPYSSPNPLTTWEYALLPNDPTVNRNPSGGANTDYTAADFQHMLLAAQVPNTLAPGGVQTLPSLHRPALVNYWINRLSRTSWADLWIPKSGQDYRDLCRKIMLRPIGGGAGFTDPNDPPDHPNFTGSNQNPNGFDPINGPWDVDNDGDGVPDSVWVDLGEPVRATTDGRLYKPLFAILCQDLDGRLNLNAHGCEQQLATTYYQQLQPLGLGSTFHFAGDVTLPTPPAPATLLRGQGYGPAEINPAYLYGNPPSGTWATEFTQMLYGTATISGRFGESNIATPTQRRPGYTSPNGYSSSTIGYNCLSENKWFEFWARVPSAYFPATWTYWDCWYTTNPYRANAYGTPPAMNGASALGLDLAGRPLYLWMGQPYYSGDLYSEQTNNPYQVNLSNNVGRGLPDPNPAPDNPFSPAELERVLRPFDKDAATLPSRLVTLMPSLATTPANRLKVTTESWDLPVPSVLLPPSIATSGGHLTNNRPCHVTDLLQARGIPSTAWISLFPQELLAGLKLNLNRLLGNGRDINNCYSVNLPTENATTTIVPYVDVNGNQVTVPPLSTPVLFDFLNNGTTTTANSALAARQLHARYLYVLALLLNDQYWAASPGPGPGQRDPIAKQTAQWAINVIDFYGCDSSMTPFPYDPAPFTTGWNPPGTLTYQVWGCKRPELLLTETLAFHDRRTQDLANDDGVGAFTTNSPPYTNPPNSDPDFDQQLRPEGSLFVELYCPWTMMEPKSADIYGTGQGSAQSGVNLQATTPASGATLPSPVWRMIVLDPTQNSSNITGDIADPDDPNPPTPLTIERGIYFLAYGTVKTPGDESVEYFSSSATPGNSILGVWPGQYAVIGPGTSGSTT